MANLTYPEKLQFERLFGMDTGYVLDFTNSTFQAFVFDSVGRNIYDTSYERGTGSKANRLRALWKREPNHLVGKLLADLLDHCLEHCMREGQEELHAQCRRTVTRLLQSGPVDDADVFRPKDAERDFDIVARAVRDAIDRNEPEQGLDRLHTFVVKYVRGLCSAQGISTDRDKPLHSLLGEYIKALRRAGLIESEMTERILKSSISLLEAFNRVRNEQSLAHDNPLLNYHESLLIYNSIASTIRFIQALEERRAKPGPANPGTDSLVQIPFLI